MISAASTSPAQHGLAELFGDSSCWVRVARRSAVGGMGNQFLPRVGQEVRLQFIENDLDSPVIVGNG